MGYRGRGFWRKHLNKDQDIDLSESSHGAFVRTHRGDDTIVGSNFNDWILSDSGDDTVEGGAGNDVMFGGRGQDTGVFSGSLLDYQVYGCGPWTFVVGQDGCDFLHRFEILQFDDFTLNLRGNNGPLAALRSADLDTSEDDGFSFQVDVYDMDGDPVSVASASVTGGGTVAVSQGAASQASAMGTSSGLEITFDPGTSYDSLAAGESATETVTLVLSDGQGGTTTVTYDITIEGENDGPVAVAVNATLAEDGPEVILAADFTDVDASDSHSFSVDTTGTQGTVTDNGDGTFGYDPAGAFDSLGAGESATDTFTYTVDDGNGGTATETVTITINGSNDGPVAAAVVDSADEDGPGITIAANFTDVDASDSHSFSVDTTGTQGTVTDNGDGTFGYDPAGAFDSLGAGESATDTFTYTVDDGNRGTATETVTITINGSNDGPVAVAVNATLAEDGPEVILAADFTDVDASDSHSFSVDTTGTQGTVTDNGDGTFGYDPAGAFDSLGAGESATDTFTYTVDDGNGGTATETVTITINGSNDGPVAQPVTAVSEEDSQVVIGDSVGSQIVPNMGYHYVFNFDTGVATAIPRDGGANKTPQQIADQYLPDGNGMVFGANPNNSGWGASAVIFVDGVETTIPPTDFVVTDSDGGSIDTTNPGWIAFGDDNKNVDEISITVTDLALSNGTTVDVTVSAGPFDYEVNGATDNVLVQGVSFEATVNTPSPEVTITADVSDVDGDTFVFSVDTTGTLGSVVDNGDGTFDYSADGMFEHLDDGETATDTFTYTVTDDQGATDTETVTIVINGADDLLFA
ncbi:VCBS domain-containing protein [Pseudophaeobacter sp. EL27]|uniref:VCBS domain-containing protein n=1 Tax=Pseudophaeobacter sp. EL27 TaxID=2107580 RepID=UPI000EFCA1DF|nr:Ig-like domain-containing protein [Pseudophaeobacter sp. EL27]